MTTIVITSEEDPALSIVRFTSELAWADAGPEVPYFPLFSTFPACLDGSNGKHLKKKKVKNMLEYLMMSAQELIIKKGWKSGLCI